MHSFNRKSAWIQWLWQCDLHPLNVFCFDLILSRLPPTWWQRWPPAAPGICHSRVQLQQERKKKNASFPRVPTKCQDSESPSHVSSLESFSLAEPESCVGFLELGGLSPTNPVTWNRGKVTPLCKIKVLLAEAEDAEAGLTSTTDVHWHLHPSSSLPFPCSK